MKAEEVIDAALNLSPKDVKSSAFKWIASKQLLVATKVKEGAPYVIMARFDGVTFVHYDIGKFSERYAAKSKWRDAVTKISETDLVIASTAYSEVYSGYAPIKRRMSSHALMATILRQAFNADDFNSPWECTWEHLLCAYASQFNKYRNDLSTGLSAFHYSPELKKMNARLVNLDSVLREGTVYNLRENYVELEHEFYEVLNKLRRMNSLSNMPYSKGDGIAYARTKLLVQAYPNLNGVHLGARAKVQDLMPHWQIMNGEKMLSNWDKLTNLFKLMGLPVPTPFGIDFTDENIPALSALYDAAKHNMTNYSSWYRETKLAPTETKPTANTEPTSLLA